MGYERYLPFPESLLTYQELRQLGENDHVLSSVYGNYRRPNLKYVSSTIVSVEENFSDALTTKVIDNNGYVLFADGVDIGNFRGCDLTKTFNHTSNVPQSGLYSGLTLTADRWYFLYAVRCTSSGLTDKFVIVAESLPPIGSNAATLISRYGGDWGPYYLGTIRYGDSNGFVGVLPFKMAAGLTMFMNQNVGNSGFNGNGILFNTTASAQFINYAYSAGVGDLQIPNNLRNALWLPLVANANDQCYVSDLGGFIGGGRRIAQAYGGYGAIIDLSAYLGIEVRCLAARALDIFLAGFRDGFFYPSHNKYMES